VIGEQYEQTVQEMMSMGFPRSQIIAAMRASFNNPDRAMEYLLSVIKKFSLRFRQMQPKNPKD